MKRLGSGRGMVAAVSLALASAAPAQAAEPIRSMAALEERVQPGTQVDIVDRQGRIFRGDFVRADDEGILVSLHGSAEGRRVPAADVMTVTRAGDSLKNGALIGAAFGAISSLLVFGDDGSAGDPLCADTACKVSTSAFVTVFYAGVGVLVDHLIKGRTVAYRAPERVSWSLTPHPVPRGAGLQLAVAF